MLDPELPEPEPTPDLVWMLLSNQIDQRRLIHKLVEEFYLELYPLALERLGDPKAARQTVEHTLAELVIKAHRYDATQDIRDWMQPFFERVIRRSLRRQSIKKNYRLEDAEKQQGIASNVVDELDPAQMNLLISSVENAIHTRRRWMKVSTAIQWSLLLSLALFLLLRLGWKEDWSLPPPLPSSSIINTRIITQVIRITTRPTVTPFPSITPTPTPFPPNAVLYTVKPGDTLQGIAEKTGINAAILIALNGLKAFHVLTPGQRLVITIGELPQAMITPTQVTPATTRDALTAQSSAEEIVQRMQENFKSWHTLWLDAQIIDYGPPSYIGPPFVIRGQLWLISQQDGLYLNGMEGEAQPERITLRINVMIYTTVLDDELPNVTNSNASPILNYTPLSQLFNVSFSTQAAPQMVVLGEEVIAGRRALAIDMYEVDTHENGEVGNEYFAGRFSIDVHTGVVLRLQHYLDPEHRIPGQELRVTDIRYDQDFPAELFVPFSGAIAYFSQGPDGKPEDADSLANRSRGLYASGRDALPRRTPPPDFDPSGSDLTFQYKSLTRLGGARDLAEVFADGYFLGMLEFADPWNINCARSPNGRYIAYFPYLEEAPYRGRLRWFDLLNLGSIHFPPMPDILPQYSNMAFSPDNSLLAFVGCQETDNNCAIYLLELSSGDARRFLELVNAYSLAWSPDGRQLAFIGALTNTQDSEAHIVNIHTGEIISSEALNWENSQLADPNSPILSWGITFPVYSYGLESCTALPEQ